MPDFRENLAAIAALMSDYRAGDIAKPTPKHVEKWVGQFPNDLWEPLAAEMAHVLGHTYLSHANVVAFLRRLLTHAKLCGDDPAAFWRDACILDIQGGGRSQHEMLLMLDGLMQKTFGFGIPGCGKKPKHFIYIDDGLFTGNRILRDLQSWLQKSAPQEATVHVIVMALHNGGQYYAAEKLAAAAKAVGKKLDFTWWRLIELEDRRSHTYSSDVLRVTKIPDNARTKAYADALKYPVVLRKPGSIGERKIFSSEEGRNLLEQQMLMAGTLIREKCPHLKPFQRPLGNMVLETLGFGSTIVTFRNCPNNAPLAFWAGDPWYPLFPRKTN